MTRIPSYTRRRPRPIRSPLLAVAAGVNVLVALLTIFSAYGGMFSPNARVIASFAAMALPAMLLAGIIIAILDLLIDRRLILALAAGWAISMPSLLVFSPLHFGSPRLTPEQKEREFTFMTYNALHFLDFRGKLPSVTRNATVGYIIDTDADIVSLQEVENIHPNPDWHLTRAMIDTLKILYPHRIVGMSNQLTILSKYPMEPVEVSVPPDVRYAIGCVRIDIDGSPVHLLNVHLKSIGLTPDDKTLYKDVLTDVPKNRTELRSEMRQVKSELFSKLAEAFVVRAHQARAVKAVVDSIGGPFIVAGDFNDVPNCYAIRTIRSAHLRDAYADAAFGPCITYHGDHFYFRIDQILYKGPFKAISVKKGDINSSDHNPLLATFLMDADP